MRDWMSTYLAALGAPNSKQNRSFLASWQRWEGGHTANSAKFNYMNSTQRMPGSSGINSVGVQRYKNLQQGAQAFAQTLKNGRYGDIVGALKAGNPYKHNITAGLSTWLSGSPNSPSGASYASKVLGTRVAAPPPGGQPQSASGAPRRLQPPRVRKLAARPRGPDMQALMQQAAPTGVTQDILSRLGGMAGRVAEAGMNAAPVAMPQLPPQFAQEFKPFPGQRAPGSLTPRVEPFKPTGKLGKLSFAPGADRAGVKSQPDVIAFGRRVAAVFGQPLQVGTGTDHSRLTVDGNVSQHWSGHALDIPASGKTLTRLGQAALIAAGMSPKEARKQKGGLFNVGSRQVIFNTMEGGNHYTHLHIGA